MKIRQKVKLPQTAKKYVGNTHKAKDSQAFCQSAPQLVTQLAMVWSGVSFSLSHQSVSVSIIIGLYMPIACIVLEINHHHKQQNN